MPFSKLTKSLLAAALVVSGCADIDVPSNSGTDDPDLTCAQIWNCYSKCDEDGAGTDCYDDCHARGASDTVKALDSAIWTCADAVDPQPCNSLYCVWQNCPDEYTNCNGIGKTHATCEAVATCLDGCDEWPCRTDCFDAATPEAKTASLELLECVQEQGCLDTTCAVCTNEKTACLAWTAP